MITATPYGEVLQIKMCRFPDFPSGTWVCAYLVDGLLIDTGPAHTAGELVTFLRDKGVQMVVNTHAHEDHIAANRSLQETYGIHIYAHRLAVEMIRVIPTLYPYQQEIWGMPEPSEVSPLGQHIETAHHLFEVIPTPGHAREHICLFNREKGWLFSGDLYVSEKPKVCRPNDDMCQIIEDLKRIFSLCPAFIFPAPAHILEKPRERLSQLIEYLEGLREKILGLYQQGIGIEVIRDEVFGDEGIICELTQGQFSSLNMVRSFVKGAG